MLHIAEEPEDDSEDASCDDSNNDEFDETQCDDTKHENLASRDPSHQRMQHTTSNADCLVHSPTLHLSVPNQASCEIRSQATSDGTNQASCERTNTVLYRPSHQRIPNDVSSLRCVPHLEVSDDVSSHRCVPYTSEIQNDVSSQRCVLYDEVSDDAWCCC